MLASLSIGWVVLSYFIERKTSFLTLYLWAGLLWVPAPRLYAACVMLIWDLT